MRDPHQFWLDKWKESDIPFHQDTVELNLIQYFPLLSLQANDTIFVPLCGKSHDLWWLLEKGLHVIGVELSHIACKDFFSEKNLAPIISAYKSFTLYQHNNLKIFCGDFFNLTPEDCPSIQAIYDCKALIALPADIRVRYVKHLIYLTANRAQILLNILDTEDTVKSPPYPIKLSEIETLYVKDYHVRLLKTESHVNLAEHLYLKGFTQLTEHILLLTPK